MDRMREALLHFLELDDFRTTRPFPPRSDAGGQTLNAETEGCPPRGSAKPWACPLGDLGRIEQATGIDVPYSTLARMNTA